MGRSLGVGSLTIWTHHLKTGDYNTSFVPRGCGKSAVPTAALVAAAGIQVEDLYELADKHNATSIGGYCPTPGAGRYPDDLPVIHLTAIP
jgi:hypothetical protein